GTAVHFDGAAWAPVVLGDVPLLNAVACTGGGPYIGGFFGYAARLTGGAARVVAMPAELADLGVHGITVGSRRVVAVGGGLLPTAANPQRGFPVESRRESAVFLALPVGRSTTNTDESTGVGANGREPGIRIRATRESQIHAPP